jgi:hypothetical protein
MKEMYPEWTLRLFGASCAQAHVRRVMGAVNLEDGWKILEDPEELVPFDDYMPTRASSANLTRCGLEMIITLTWLRNILHRAVDTSIYVEKTGRFVLGDFGRAKYSETRTTTLVSIRDPPPEWGQPYHQELDFWLLGCALKRYTPIAPTAFLTQLIRACLNPSPTTRLAEIARLSYSSQVQMWSNPPVVAPRRLPMYPHYTLTYSGKQARRLREVWTQLSSPNLAKMVSVIQSGMEWHTSFDAEGYVPLSTRSITPEILSQLRDAVAHIHSQGYMIRNLQPSHILVKDNHVLIVDLSEAVAIKKVGWCYTTYPPDWYRDPRMVHGGYDQDVDFFALRRFM